MCTEGYDIITLKLFTTNDMRRAIIDVCNMMHNVRGFGLVWFSYGFMVEDPKKHIKHQAGDKKKIRVQSV